MQDIRRLTLDQLRAFVSVAEASSFTDAARVQLRTQTAMTRQINGLEDVLGHRVLKRTRGHVEGLTEIGKRLLPFARRTLATIDDAWIALSSPNVSGSIRVGVMDDIDVGWLNGLLARFREAQPDCEVRAVSDFSVRLEKRLENREIDIAVVKRLGAVDSPLRDGLVRREPLIWAAGPGFRCDPERPVPLVVFQEGCVYRAHILENLRKSGIASFVAYEGQSYANVRNAVWSGFGITALARSQIEAGGLLPLPAVGEIALADLGMVEIVIRYAKVPNSPALRTFVREIERHMVETPGYASLPQTPDGQNRPSRIQSEPVI